jgi:hypothetical protein
MFAFMYYSLRWSYNHLNRPIHKRNSFAIHLLSVAPQFLIFVGRTFLPNNSCVRSISFASEILLPQKTAVAFAFAMGNKKAPHGGFDGCLGAWA